MGIRGKGKETGWSFTSREGALARGKTEHCVVFFPLLRFLSPLAAPFLPLPEPLAPPQNPLGQTVFFAPLLYPKIFVSDSPVFLCRSSIRPFFFPSWTTLLSSFSATLLIFN